MEKELTNIKLSTKTTNKNRKQMLQQETYPAIWTRLRPKLGHPWSYPYKIAEDLSEMWPNCRAEFHAVW